MKRILLTIVLALAMIGICHAAPQVIGSNSATATSGSITVNKPANTVNGNVLVAWMSCKAGVSPTPGVFTDPVGGGWTTLGTDIVDNTNFIRYHAAYKVANNEGASWVWSNASTHTFLTGGVIVLRGCSTTTPVDTSSNNNVTSAGTAGSATGVTTGGYNCMLLAGYAGYRSTTGTTNISVPPSGMTVAWNVANREFTALYSVVQGAAGATGAKAATIANASYWGAKLISIRGAAGFIPGITRSFELIYGSLFGRT